METMTRDRLSVDAIQLLNNYDISEEELKDNPDLLSSLKMLEKFKKNVNKFMMFGDSSAVDDDVTEDIYKENDLNEDIFSLVAPAASGVQDFDQPDGLLDCIKPKPKEKKSNFEVELLRRVNCLSPEDRYDILNFIAVGGTSKVVKARCKVTKMEIAIKMMKVNDLQRKDLILGEIDAMKQLQHQNIINFIDSYYIKETVWIVMEYMDGGALSHIVAKDQLIESQVASISVECLKGLQHLHEKRIVHRDIKGGNVLVSKSGMVKLTDFGFCTQLSDDSETTHSQLGTINWMSPEVVKGIKYGNKIDIWCFGMTCVEMITGGPPFKNWKVSEILKHLRTKGAPEISFESTVTQQFVLNRCLCIDPRKRATATELLSDPFLQNAVHPSTFIPSFFTHKSL